MLNQKIKINGCFSCQNKNDEFAAIWTNQAHQPRAHKPTKPIIKQIMFKIKLKFRLTWFNFINVLLNFEPQYKNLFWENMPMPMPAQFEQIKPSFFLPVPEQTGQAMNWVLFCWCFSSVICYYPTNLQINSQILQIILLCHPELACEWGICNHDKRGQPRL